MPADLARPFAAQGITLEASASPMEADYIHNMWYVKKNFHPHLVSTIFLNFLKFMKSVEPRRMQGSVRLKPSEHKAFSLMLTLII